jgi:hypothetical protein
MDVLFRVFSLGCFDFQVDGNKRESSDATLEDRGVGSKEGKRKTNICGCVYDQLVNLHVRVMTKSEGEIFK